ncbi:hypothetical protein CERSUDRAFT_99383 [Gelatoporia subvermispora B]|uniref:Uncharacterized protein n=1 Tax=Ceriporiopsis subvermispora (strain B) TaxID=914234 RepID=M2QKI7_CERS8|nr:hypothetical protein CERSUDRAFT_99383 [Gelatoporia subvermispora B]
MSQDVRACSIRLEAALHTSVPPLGTAFTSRTEAREVSVNRKRSAVGADRTEAEEDRADVFGFEGNGPIGLSPASPGLSYEDPPAPRNITPPLLLSAFVLLLSIQKESDELLKALIAAVFLLLCHLHLFHLPYRPNGSLLPLLPAPTPAQPTPAQPVPAAAQPAFAPASTQPASAPAPAQPTPAAAQPVPAAAQPAPAPAQPAAAAAAPLNTVLPRARRTVEHGIGLMSG